MEHFVKRLDKAYDAIDYADYILVGAGAGFSAAAGSEEKWAYWSRHVYMNRYSVGKTELMNNYWNWLEIRIISS